MHNLVHMLPRLERHSGAYPGHQRRLGQPRCDGGLTLGGRFGWLQLSGDRREDPLTGQAEHDE
jgi:hypothetical protein